MQAKFIPVSVILDSFSFESGTVIEFTFEALTGNFGVFYRIGNFAFTVEFTDEIEAISYFFASVEIEQHREAIRRILNPVPAYTVIEFEIEEITAFPYFE